MRRERDIVDDDDNEDRRMVLELWNQRTNHLKILTNQNPILSLSFCSGLCRSWSFRVFRFQMLRIYMIRSFIKICHLGFSSVLPSVRACVFVYVVAVTIHASFPFECDLAKSRSHKNWFTNGFEPMSCLVEHFCVCVCLGLSKQIIQPIPPNSSTLFRYTNIYLCRKWKHFKTDRQTNEGRGEQKREDNFKIAVVRTERRGETTNCWWFLAFVLFFSF